LGFTNDRRFPATRRVFVGWRLAIHSLVVLIAFTALVGQLFQKDPKWEDMKPFFGTLLVWVPSWLIHLLLLRFYGTAPAARLHLPGVRRGGEDCPSFSRERPASGLCSARGTLAAKRGRRHSCQFNSAASSQCSYSCAMRSFISSNALVVCFTLS